MPRSLTSLALAVLAVLALLTHPVAAAQACARNAPAASASTGDAPAMANMPMAGTDRPHGRPATGACCDHGGKSKPAGNCAQVCAFACATPLASPAVYLSTPLLAERVALAPHADSPAPGRTPSGLDRPPKTIA